MKRNKQLYGLLELRYDCLESRPNVDTSITLFDSKAMAKNALKCSYQDDLETISDLEDTQVVKNQINDSECLVALNDNMYYHRARVIPVKLETTYSLDNELVDIVKNEVEG
jgi:hypothetical protein